jgi:hypothetical protein
VNLLRRVLYPTLKALGLPQAGWRAFRRSVATALSEMRGPVRTAQQVLGHSSPQTTLTFYVQSVEESQRRAVAKLEEVMMPTCAPVALQIAPKRGAGFSQMIENNWLGGLDSNQDSQSLPKLLM